MANEQKNAILAIVLSGAILFFWQMYFSPAPVQAPAAVDQSVSPHLPSTTTSSKIVTEEKAPIVTNESLQNITIESNSSKVVFDSQFTLLELTNSQAAKPLNEIVGSSRPFQFEADFGQGFKKINFNLENNEYVSTEGIRVQAVYNDQGILGLSFNSMKDFKFRLLFNTTDLKLENGQVRNFSIYTDSLDLIGVGDVESGDKLVKWMGIDFNYHFFSVFLDSALPLLYQTDGRGNLVITQNKSIQNLNLNFLFAKKDFNYLSSLGNNLKGAVDFGFWGFFAIWILKALQFFYSYLPNYGMAIIFLTFVIRLITFPLQYKSFVGMKKLQTIQPELQKIREKFKDDPARMQQESMGLFKKSGANPLGGCLPLILQMPVFFAFYKVLYSAVELVDAPFYGWITDLSNKDQFYILPLLMTAAMFLQQKITPSTMTDPVQKKIFMFMPIIFGFIMKDLPSGLSLYIFVSTVLGILQQSLVFSRKSA